jgi:thiol-disulfide isomerase/thioredoxin
VKQRWLWFGLAVALFTAIGTTLVYMAEPVPDPNTTRVDGPVVGDAILNTTLPGLDDKPQSIGQWRGKVLVVNFWAAWCPPCRDEIPDFIHLQEQYRAQGVQFVGIAVDDKAPVVAYVREMGINYPILISLDAMDLARRAGNNKNALPYTLLINRSGQVISAQFGALAPGKLEKQLQSML